MKKILSSVLIVAVSAILIILGIVVPNNMDKNFMYYQYKSDYGFPDDVFSITVYSKKDLTVESVKIEFDNSFGENQTIKLNGDTITKTQEGDEFIYKFDAVGDLMSFEIDEITFKTTSGEYEIEYSKNGNNNMAIFLRIIFFTLAGVVIVVGIIMMIDKKKQKKLLQQSSTYIDEDFDDESSTYEEEPEIKEDKSILDTISEVLNPTPKYYTCEYCGTENEGTAKKCSSCGAKIKKN